MEKPLRGKVGRKEIWGGDSLSMCRNTSLRVRLSDLDARDAKEVYVILWATFGCVELRCARRGV